MRYKKEQLIEMVQEKAFADSEFCDDEIGTDVTTAVLEAISADIHAKRYSELLEIVKRRGLKEEVIEDDEQ